MLLEVMKGMTKPLQNILFHFVDVRDVADALLLVYEKPEASGRYICAPHQTDFHEIVKMLRGMYPNYPYQQEKSQASLSLVLFQLYIIYFMNSPCQLFMFLKWVKLHPSP
ncbi:Tetraketide alpha-pyrone reductase 2 [Apostasia shenzhenica]|uniref:Tetraketide alpha-pyrone reductase 2 n=1 Tax=Apostasia shenzhenica TaxID=1088818 RepID=A0A2H9ZVN6_9ASPA|nr:Tetraketide alpha-pyrone reductase 2 [Apostasia shenzhenica]